MVRQTEEISSWEKFFRTMLSSLNPRTYHILSKNPLYSSFRYFVHALFFCIVVMMLLSIPNLFNLPDYIQTEMGSFTALSVDVNQEMNSPFVLTASSPLLTVDTTGQTESNDAKILVTQDTITYRLLPFTAPLELSFPEGDLLANKLAVASLLWTIILLMIPGLLILAFIMAFFKYVLLILLAAFLGFILTGVIRFQIRFSQLLNVAIYSTTIAMVIEFFTKPFLVNSFFLHYIFFAVYFILGMISSGEFDTTHPKNAEKRLHE